MIDKLVTKIEEANLAYRTGNSIMSDSDYDGLSELCILTIQKMKYLVKIEVIDETRKSKLPIDMASMNKIKSIDEINT
jgi:hypothetical protein